MKTLIKLCGCTGWFETRLGAHVWRYAFSCWSSFKYFNHYHYLGIVSRWQVGDIFLIFPRKQNLTFHANCLHWRQFAWNVKTRFLGKRRKIFQNVICWKFYPECLAIKHFQWTVQFIFLMISVKIHVTKLPKWMLKSTQKQWQSVKNIKTYVTCKTMCCTPDFISWFNKKLQIFRNK